MKILLRILGCICLLIGMVMDTALGLPLVFIIYVSYRFNLKRLNHLAVDLKFKVAEACCVAPLHMILQSEFKVNCIRINYWCQTLSFRVK